MMSRSLISLILFFFSSRRRHTRFDCDWSSDVCSSDLAPDTPPSLRRGRKLVVQIGETFGDKNVPMFVEQLDALELADKLKLDRSEERRVGKECRSRWSAYH